MFKVVKYVKYVQKGVKYVQTKNQKNVNDAVLVFFWLTLNIF